jgi:hypothetical protein
MGGTRISKFTAWLRTPEGMVDLSPDAPGQALSSSESRLISSAAVTAAVEGTREGSGNLLSGASNQTSEETHNTRLPEGMRVFQHVKIGGAETTSRYVDLGWN